MKQILITLSLCVSSLCFSQDTLQIPAIELEEFFLALDTLETQDSIKTILIGQLEKQIEFHLELNDHNENLISYKDQEIELLNNQEAFNKINEILYFLNLHIREVLFYDKDDNRRSFCKSFTNAWY